MKIFDSVYWGNAKEFSTSALTLKEPILSYNGTILLFVNKNTTLGVDSYSYSPKNKTWKITPSIIQNMLVYGYDITDLVLGVKTNYIILGATDPFISQQIFVLARFK